MIKSGIYFPYYQDCIVKKNIYLYLFLSLLKLFDWINEFSVSHFFPNLSLRNCYPKCPNHSSFSGFFRFVAIKIDILFIFLICIFCFCSQYFKCYKLCSICNDAHLFFISFLFSVPNETFLSTSKE
jgi:hypothetical protein